jgi:hypothetical protein
MSAFLGKRPKRCFAAKYAKGPGADSPAAWLRPSDKIREAVADASSDAAKSLRRRALSAEAGGTQGQDAQRRGRPLIGRKHNPEPSVGDTMRDLPGWHLDEPGPCQSRTDQRIEVIGAKPGWNAQRSSHCAVLEAPFRHAWYIAEAQAVLLNQIVRRCRLVPRPILFEKRVRVSPIWPPVIYFSPSAPPRSDGKLPIAISFRPAIVTVGTSSFIST